MLKRSKSSISVKSTRAIVWRYLADPAYWSTANKQIIAIRRDATGALMNGESFEIDTQFESGDPVVTTRTEIANVLPCEQISLVYSNNSDERKEFIDFYLAERKTKTTVTVSVTTANSLVKWLLPLFGLTESRILRDSFLRGIKRQVERHNTG